jgi:hypothetical protein
MDINNESLRARTVLLEGINYDSSIFSFPGVVTITGFQLLGDGGGMVNSCIIECLNQFSSGSSSYDGEYAPGTQQTCDRYGISLNVMTPVHITCTSLKFKLQDLQYGLIPQLPQNVGITIYYKVKN